MKNAIEIRKLKKKYDDNFESSDIISPFFYFMRPSAGVHITYNMMSLAMLKTADLRQT